MKSYRYQKRVMTGTAIMVLVLSVAVVALIAGAVARFTNKEKPVVEATEEKVETVVADTTPTERSSARFARLQTNLGVITIELYPEAAPKTVTNFVTLIKQGYYNGLTFHRVAKDFVVQGGDPNGDGTGGKSIYGDTFEDEINADSLGLAPEVKSAYEQMGYKYRSDLTSHKMVRGSVAMANRGANTNGSQFFIVTVSEQPHLDGKHTVFGAVIEGMDVVEKMNGVEVGSYGHPVSPLIINEAKAADSLSEL